MNTPAWKPDLVIYHSPCADGFGAALCAYRAYGGTIEYHGSAYGDPPPDVSSKNVLIVDFSYPKETLAMMAAAGGAKSIVVLDHHKTAKEALQQYTVPDMPSFSLSDINRDDDEGVYLPEHGLDGCNILAQFDMRRSGARMAHDFLFPKEPVPAMIALIEDRDLWSFSDPRTKPFAQYLRSIPFDFEAWQNLLYHMEFPESRASILSQGAAIQRYFDKMVEEVAEQARMVVIAGHEVPCVNANWTFSSDVCHRLLELYPDAPFAASYFDTKEGRRQFSFRSQDDREDVSAVAKKYGGGGHRNASGATVAPIWGYGDFQGRDMPHVIPC